MIALSTVYNISKFDNPRDLIADIKSLGFSVIELNIGVPENFIPELAKELKIVSVHNFCPKLDFIPEGKTIFSPYNFASDDKTERRTAVDLTKKTIDVADTVGAKAVIVHSGEINMEISGKDLSRKYNETKDKNVYKKFLDDFLKERKSKLADSGIISNLLKSIDELLNYAVKKNIKLGIENRFWADELPSLEDYKPVFEKFDSNSLGLWFDIGHAVVAEKQGLVKSRLDFLKNFSGRLIGMHLHDVIEVYPRTNDKSIGAGVYDHKAPGKGEVDFDEIAKFVKNGTILVNETHPSSTREELKKSIEHLKAHGFRNFIDNYSFEPLTV
ncbi:MAG: sugar phosphate isomerase/epimerase [Elusimicrobia bacterium]|nr:sugar phosphate isomerase/epimerase [Elusimicrobiota bacterium]